MYDLKTQSLWVTILKRARAHLFAHNDSGFKYCYVRQIIEFNWFQV